MSRDKLSTVITQLIVRFCEVDGNAREELEKEPPHSPTALFFVNNRVRKPRQK